MWASRLAASQSLASTTAREQTRAYTKCERVVLYVGGWLARLNRGHRSQECRLSVCTKDCERRAATIRKLLVASSICTKRITPPFLHACRQAHNRAMHTASRVSLPVRHDQNTAVVVHAQRWVGIGLFPFLMTLEFCLLCEAGKAAGHSPAIAASNHRHCRKKGRHDAEAPDSGFCSLGA